MSRYDQQPICSNVACENQTQAIKNSLKSVPKVEKKSAVSRTKRRDCEVDKMKFLKIVIFEEI